MVARPQNHREQHDGAELVRQGKVRYFGVSNFRGWRIAELVRIAGQLGMPAPAVCQPYYNLLNRQPEVEVLPACAHYGLGVVAYSPLARGVLTGKYRPDEAPAADSRAGRADKRILQGNIMNQLPSVITILESERCFGINKLVFLGCKQMVNEKDTVF